MLNQELGRVKAKYGTKILYVDVYDLLDNVILATKAGKPYVIGESPFTLLTIIPCMWLYRSTYARCAAFLCTCNSRYDGLKWVYFR